MTETEREMIRPLTLPAQPLTDRFTSLQATYEDSLTPEADAWDEDDQAG